MRVRNLIWRLPNPPGQLNSLFADCTAIFYFLPGSNPERIPPVQTIADNKIVYARELFSRLGEVETVDHSDLTGHRLRGQDILLTRTEKRVDAALLAGTGIRFVGSPTSGTDHIDLDYLRTRDIGFAHAPGSNARSVAEYVLAALLAMSAKLGRQLAGLTLGVIGVGHIGTLVAQMGEALGMRVLCNDPPRQAIEHHGGFCDIGLLESADFITIHVPLTQSGHFPTFHLFDQTRLNKLKSNCVLINTARGAVVDNAALERLLTDRKIAGAVLDVWENEPGIDMKLLNRVDIATPHVAGYSWDGKLRGTQMVYEAACKYFRAVLVSDGGPPAAEMQPITLPAGLPNIQKTLSWLVPHFYDIHSDDSNMRQRLQASGQLVARAFSDLRKEYGIRREFNSRQIQLDAHESVFAPGLANFGFETELI